MVVFSPPLVVSSTAISGVLASSTDASATTLTGDAFEPISSILAAYSSGCSAAYLAASSAAFLAFSALSASDLATWAKVSGSLFSVSLWISSSSILGTSLLSWCPPTTRFSSSWGSSRSLGLSSSTYACRTGTTSSSD